MKMHQYLLVLVAVTLKDTSSRKILVVFPFPTKSHNILGDGFVRHLLKDGHEVTYVSPLSTPRIAHSMLRYINVNETYNALPEMNIKAMMTGKLSLSIDTVLQLSHDIARVTLKHPGVQTLLLDPTEQFDLVIAEWMFSDLYCGLGAILKCPLIWSSSLDSHWMVRRLVHQPDNPAYTPDYSSTYRPPLNFRQRVGELWTIISATFTMYQMQSTVEAVYREVYTEPATNRDISLPPYRDVVYNASLVFLNSHISYGWPSAMPQNVKYIGGYHIETPIKPLPENLKKIMDSAKDGIIYFSMGSVLKSSEMPAALKTGLLDMFSKLKQTVIWKFEDKLPGAPDNVHIVNWAPQPSILSHPNCVLFITHGGLLSTTEAIHAGVPLIGIPMFADQFQNMEKAAAKGFALRIDLTGDTPTILMDAIKEILTNQSYKNTVKTLSSLYHARPLPPSSELVFWVDHVMTHGAAHLRSIALDVPLYQKLYLDLIVVTLVSVVTLYVLIKYIFNLSSKQNYYKKYK